MQQRTNYTDDEKERRFEIFKDNLWFILEHNSNVTTCKLGLNQFADLTNDEYRSMFVGGGEVALRDNDINNNNEVLKGDDRFKYASDKLPE